jgi:hypothetical protein
MKKIPREITCAAAILISEAAPSRERDKRETSRERPRGNEESISQSRERVCLFICILLWFALRCSAEKQKNHSRICACSGPGMGVSHLSF